MGALPSLIPGGPPFVWVAAEAAADSRNSVGALKERLDAQADELDAAIADRAQLAEANRGLREQVQDLKRRLRSEEDRRAAIEQRLAPEIDPLGSARGFLLAVRIAYARQFEEGDRHGHPLQRMRVGPAFLSSLRGIDGIDVQKVIDVCAQVGANAAHELDSREVHQLHEGQRRGSGRRVRARDDAQAWRCALQRNTPSARRLHWWAIPGADGATIEFATVNLHDDYSIPE